MQEGEEIAIFDQYIASYPKLVKGTAFHRFTT